MVTLGFENDGLRDLFVAGTPAGSGPAQRRLAIGNGGQLHVQEAAREVVGSGFAGIDALLPAGGLRRGSLVEWLVGPAGGPALSQHEAAIRTADTEPGDLAGGAGAATLAFAVASRLAGTAAGRQTIVVVDRTEWFHPPAVLPWLTAGQQLVVARPGRDDDEIWAIDQALRCSGVAAVVAWPRPRGQARQRSHWSTALRRWQLAARSSGAVGLLVRPQAAARDPSWAEARIAVEPLPGGTLAERRLRLTRVGGSWVGSEHHWSAETILDLVRGTAAGPRPASRSSPRLHEQRVGREGGAACRAS